MQSDMLTDAKMLLKRKGKFSEKAKCFREEYPMMMVRIT